MYDSPLVIMTYERLSSTGKHRGPRDSHNVDGDEGGLT